MAKTGCTFNGGRCLAVTEQCESCGNAKEYPSGVYCTVFANPASKWTLGRCNFATHFKIEGKKDEKMLNPLKASKRAASKK